MLVLQSSLSFAVDFKTSSNDSFLNDSINKEQKIEAPEFLKVNEAFKFSSESSDTGLKLKWTISEDYYLYLERFKFASKQEGAVVGEPRFSTSGKEKQDPYFGTVHVIHDAVEVFLPITFTDMSLNDAEIKVTYQGCAEAGLCYPPKHQKILFVPTAKKSNQAPTPVDKVNDNDAINTAETPNMDEASGVFSFLQNNSLPFIAGIFFLLGIGLTFTPCVFPMIPIITSIIAGQEKPTVSKSFILSSAYVVGMAATYATAGVITGLLGASANIQAALQDPILLSVFAAIFVLLALSMFGLYELQLPSFIRDKLNSSSQKLNGGHITSVFMIGAFSALIVSPCVSAPLAGALLYISSTGDALIGGVSLFALGLGMGVPLIIIAVGGGKLFPKAGKWMDQVKNVFGIMLIAVAIWLLSRFISGELSLGLWAILFGMTASQMGAFDAANTGWPRVVKGLGLLFALYAILLTLGAFSGATNPLNPLEKIVQQTNFSKVSANKNEQVFTVIYDDIGLQEEILIAKNLGKPLMVDFYADWCISCKVMEHTIFPLPHIQNKLNQYHLVKADVTENTQKNQALLNKFGLFGPPSMLFFDQNGEEMKSLRIVGEINESGLNNILKKGLPAPLKQL